MNTRDIVVKFRVDGTAPDGAVRRKRQWVNVGSAPSTDDAVRRWLDWCRRAYPGGIIHYRGGFHRNTTYVAPGESSSISAGFTARWANWSTTRGGTL